MSKKEEKKEEVVEETVVEEAPVEEVSSDRQKRFKAFVAKYAILSPVKYAAKKAAGEFDKIPDSFK